jgi:thiol-disulfide isomerase/thioredoxin
MADDGEQREGPSKGSFVVGLLRDWGIALVVVVLVFALWNQLASTASAPSLGEAQDFVLPDLGGDAVTLSKLEQDVVVLNFWFTSCPPCRAEIPELARFHTEHPEIGLYGVSTDRGMAPGKLKAISGKLGINYPVLHDTTTEVAQRYGVSVFPTTLIIHDGQIVDAKVGAVDKHTLEEMVDLH